MKNYKSLILTGFSLVLLAGCSGVKQELGLERNSPDEFTVLKRAPLSMPPDYALRPPQPGMPRPQDAVTSADARAAVFGDDSGKDAAPTSADATLLKDTGAAQASDDIRQQVDRETVTTAPKKPMTERLLGWAHKTPDEPPATVVDPAAEAARIKTDQQTGQPVTTGDTPTKED